jgi:hypothetical protein
MYEYIFWLLIIAYSAHVMEEYILGWKEWVHEISGFDSGWDEFFVVNAVVITSGIGFAMIGFKNLYISLMFPSLMLINAVFCHILPVIIKRRFSPGVLTSIFLFVPLSLFTFYEAYKQNILTSGLIITASAGGVIIMLYPLFLQTLKKKLNIQRH